MNVGDVVACPRLVIGPEMRGRRLEPGVMDLMTTTGLVEPTTLGRETKLRAMREAMLRVTKPTTCKRVVAQRFKAAAGEEMMEQGLY